MKPSCGDNRPKLGQQAVDSKLLDKVQKKDDERIFVKNAMDMRVQLEIDNVTDRNKKI